MQDPRPAMRAEAARLAAACTACGACVEACPMPGFLPLPEADPKATAAGMRALLLGEAPSAEGQRWVAACIKSGSCTAACPEKLPVDTMMRLATIRLRGGLGEAPLVPVKNDSLWAARLKAFARMTMSEEEQAKWL